MPSDSANSILPFSRRQWYSFIFHFWTKFIRLEVVVAALRFHFNAINVNSLNARLKRMLATLRLIRFYRRRASRDYNRRTHYQRSKAVDISASSRLNMLIGRRLPAERIPFKWNDVHPAFTLSAFGLRNRWTAASALVWIKLPRSDERWWHLSLVTQKKTILSKVHRKYNLTDESTEHEYGPIESIVSTSPDTSSISFQCVCGIDWHDRARTVAFLINHWSCGSSRLLQHVINRICCIWFSNSRLFLSSHAIISSALIRINSAISDETPNNTIAFNAKRYEKLDIYAWASHASECVSVMVAFNWTMYIMIDGVAWRFHCLWKKTAWSVRSTQFGLSIAESTDSTYAIGRAHDASKIDYEWESKIIYRKYVKTNAWFEHTLPHIVDHRSLLERCVCACVNQNSCNKFAGHIGRCVSFNQKIKLPWKVYACRSHGASINTRLCTQAMGEIARSETTTLHRPPKITTIK